VWTVNGPSAITSVPVAGHVLNIKVKCIFCTFFPLLAVSYWDLILLSSLFFLELMLIGVSWIGLYYLLCFH
jgi:hypothetical protein